MLKAQATTAEATALVLFLFLFLPFDFCLNLFVTWRGLATTTFTVTLSGTEKQHECRICSRQTFLYAIAGHAIVNERPFKQQWRTFSRLLPCSYNPPAWFTGMRQQWFMLLKELLSHKASSVFSYNLLKIPDKEEF